MRSARPQGAVSRGYQVPPAPPVEMSPPKPPIAPNPPNPPTPPLPGKIGHTFEWPHWGMVQNSSAQVHESAVQMFPSLHGVYAAGSGEQPSAARVPHSGPLHSQRKSGEHTS